MSARRGGRTRAWPALLSFLMGAVLVTGGCNYSLRAGSFPPPHVRTIAVLPFENETTRFELGQEVFQALSSELPRALGLNRAGEDQADAIVRGTITRYSLEAPIYRPGEGGDRAEVLQREVNITLRVEIIDVRENVILWEGTSVRGQGQYLEASETEEVGRREAIEILVQRIVDGAQSTW